MNHLKPRDLTPEDLKKWLTEKSVRPILIDVRERSEISIAPFSSPVLVLPLSESLSWLNSYHLNLAFDRPLVVICHSGIRSLNFGIWLLDQDSRYEVWNLKGGIDAWSELIDPSIPRY